MTQEWVLRNGKKLDELSLGEVQVDSWLGKLLGVHLYNTVPFAIAQGNERSRMKMRRSDQAAK